MYMHVFMPVQVCVLYQREKISAGRAELHTVFLVATLRQPLMPNIPESDRQVVGVFTIEPHKVQSQ